MVLPVLIGEDDRRGDAGGRTGRDQGGEGVELKLYGRADYEQMLTNVAGLPADQRRQLIVAGLNELTFMMQLSVRTRLGADAEGVVFV